MDYAQVMSLSGTTRRATGILGWLVIAPLAVWIPLGVFGLAPEPMATLGVVGLAVVCAIGAGAASLIKWSGLHD